MQSNKDISKILTTLDQSTEMIVITDHDGVIYYVNSAFEQTTGISGQKVLGQSLGSLNK